MVYLQLFGIESQVWSSAKSSGRVSGDKLSLRVNTYEPENDMYTL